MTLEFMIVVVACLFLVLVMKRKTLAAIVFGLGIVGCLVATYLEQSHAERYEKTHRIVVTHQHARDAEAYARVKAAEALAKEQEIRARAQAKIAQAMAAQLERTTRMRANFAQDGQGRVVGAGSVIQAPAPPEAPAAPQVSHPIVHEILAEITSDEDFQEIAEIAPQLAQVVSQLGGDSKMSARMTVSIDSNQVSDDSDSEATSPKATSADASDEFAAATTTHEGGQGSDSEDVPDWVYDSALDSYDWDGEHFRTRILATAEDREQVEALLLTEVDAALVKMAAWYRAQQGLDDPWYDRHPLQPGMVPHLERAIVDRYDTETPEAIDDKMWPATYGLVDFDGKVLRSIEAHYDGVRSLGRASRATAGFAGVLVLLAGVNGMLRWGGSKPTGAPCRRKRRRAVVLAAAVMAIVVAMGFSLLTLLPGS